MRLLMVGDKLGLNWAKLSSNWNWDLIYLLHYIDDYKLNYISLSTISL